MRHCPTRTDAVTFGKYARRMRILMLSDVYFPRINGVSTSIQTFRRQFDGFGHEVLLIAPSYGPNVEPEPGIVRLPARSVPFDPEDRMMGFKAARVGASDARERHFDLIHIQTPFVAHYAGVALSQRLGVPRVETYHTFFEEYLHHYVPVVPGSWTRASRAASRVPSAMISTPWWCLPARCAMCCANTVFTSPWRSSHRASNWTVAGGRRCVFRRATGSRRGGAGHRGPSGFRKEHRLPAAGGSRAAEIPDVLFLVAGEGPSRGTCNADARGWTGAQRPLLRLPRPPHHAARCYCAGDVFVFASRRKPRDWCCWRRWRWACRSSRPRSWAPATSWTRAGGRWCRGRTKRSSPPM